jgi:hypothetical protein
MHFGPGRSRRNARHRTSRVGWVEAGRRPVLKPNSLTAPSGIASRRLGCVRCFAPRASRVRRRVSVALNPTYLASDAPPTGGQLLALVDALHDGTLNEAQRETVHALRVGILTLIE